MKIIRAFSSSVGKKVIMAVTGLILFGYVIGHLIGNLQLFAPPEKINSYAHFLHSLGPALWAIRVFLLVVVCLHIWMAIQLTIENIKARPVQYEELQTQRASYASRTMRVSGVIVLIFLVYHLLHFTVRIDGMGTYVTTTLEDGTVTRDVHTMMVAAYQQPLISLVYIVGVGLLSIHLRHGIASLFQSLGLRSRTWGSVLSKAAMAIAILYFIGNLAIPGAVLAGMIEIQNPEVAASALAQQ